MIQLYDKSFFSIRMHFLTYTPQRERLIVLLWGLLFAKCFIVEHYVQAYEVPVNSWLYVWGLSIAMATVATIAFWRMRTTEQLPPRVPRSLLLGWGICLAAAALLFLVAGLTPLLQLGGLPLLFSVILGGGYSWQFLHTKARLDGFPAVGWWSMAGWQLALDPGYALLAFGLGLVALVVVSMACKLVLEWYAAKAAVRALYLANDI